MTVKEYILELFKNKEFERISEKTLFKRLNVNSPGEKARLKGVLAQMVKDETLYESGKTYSLFSDCGFLRGTLKTHEKGYAFFIPEDGSPDLFVPPDCKNGALQGDTVLVKMIFPDNSGSDEAEVVKIIKRGLKRVCGVIYNERGFSRVFPDDKGFCSSIFVKKGKNLGAESGSQVVCDIVGYSNDCVYGEVTEILGEPESLAARVRSILVTQSIKTEFDGKTLAEAQKLKAGADITNISDRTDFRSLITVTIDGETAKDFDDAISVIQKEDGGYDLYVHIADVSHFVAPGGAIDSEAFERGTSVYLPEQVIPMLPEVLCDDLCSLKPDEDRLTLTVKLTYDKEGTLLEKSFYKSIIRSKRRLTYNTVQQLFDGDEQVKEELKDFSDMLFAARRLKDLLWQKREERGCVDLENEECEIIFEDGEPVAVKRESRESEKLIEEFMIAANVAVAEFLFYSELPAVYRVHESPSDEKIRSFIVFLNAVGIGKVKSLKYAMDFQSLLKAARGDPRYPVINNVMLKTMQKAQYSAENKGHFGLNEKCYCHFTSPIRRYPDLFVHRVLKAALSGTIGEIYNCYSSVSEKVAVSSSLAERKAESAERAADSVYVAKFMSRFKGDYFEGICSGVTQYGLYVRLENGAEGYVAVERLPHKGRYEFVPENYSLKNGKLKLKLGDALIVKLASTDISIGKIYFDYIGKV